MTSYGPSQNLALVLGQAKPHFSDVVCKAVYMCKRRWLRNRRRSYRLWAAAHSRLSPELQSFLSFTPDELKDPCTQALSLVDKSIDRENTKTWKIKRSTGENVALRTVLGGIVGWVDRFKQVGNNLVQYDPVHSALPWAAICLCLDLALSDIQNYNAYINGIEQVSKLAAEYAEHQNALLGGRSNLKNQLETAIVTLYLAILTYLAEARRYLESSTGRRLARNIAHTTTPKAVELLAAIEKRQAHAQRLVAAVQHEISYRKLTNIEKSIHGIESLMRSAVSPLVEKRTIILRRLGACFTDDVFDAALAKCQSNTASWIFNRDAYQKWSDLSDPTSKLLWIHGPPGTGKTILSANIIQSLQRDPSRFVSYFYCVHEDETRRNPDAIIRSCLAQLIEQIDLAVYLVYQLVGKDIHRPVVDSDIWLCFEKICKEVPNCTIVIDGFDECQSEGILSRTVEDDAKSIFLRRLINELSNTQAQVLLVSRDDADIRTEISGTPPTNLMISQYSILKEDQEQDIAIITQELINDKLSDRPQTIRDEIAQNAIDKSDGMMLWIHLLAKELRPRANAKALRRIVLEMPIGIEKAYERDLIRISQLNSDDKAQAIYILRWLLFSSRPMTIGEIVEAMIMINADADNQYPADELPDAWNEIGITENFVNDLFRRMLGSLIDIRSSSDDEPVLSHTLHFVHFSVKEYLLNSNTAGAAPTILQLASSDEENTRLASLCLRYLCLDVFGGVADSDTAEEGTSKLNNYPFSMYAAENWYWHSSHQDPMSSELLPLIETLLHPKMSNWVTWSRIFESTIRVHVVDPAYVDDSELGLINDLKDEEAGRVAFSLTNTSHESESRDSPNNSQIEPSSNSNDQQHNVRTGLTPRPMYYAGLLGIIDLVKKLWSRGYEAQQDTGMLGCVLHAAAYQGHKNIVEYLIEQGVDVQQKAGPFSYAIIASAAVGFEDLVSFLLSSGADINCQNDNGNTALHFAAGHANLGLLRRLIQDGAELEVRDKNGATALHFAVKSTNIDAVRVLLDAGADIEATLAKGRFISTALHLAAWGGLEDMIALLLEKGADVDRVGYVGASCLHISIMSGNKLAFDRIMATKAQVHLRDHGGLTAIHYAVVAQNEEMLIELLDKNIDPNVSGVDGITTALALASAICKNNDALGRTLLERGASLKPTVQDEDGPLAALNIAISSQNLDMVKLLIGKGADVNKPFRGSSPLQLSLQLQSLEIIKTLIESGADVNFRLQADTFTCLEIASMRTITSVEALQLLLENGAGSTNSSSQFTRALCGTVGTITDVKITMLLDRGADPFSLEPESIRSPLDYAMTLKNQKAMQLMIPHRSVCLKFLPILSDDIDTAVHLLEALLTNKIEVFRDALSSTSLSKDETLLNQLLIVAVIYDASDAIDYLLDRGASVLYETHQKRTAIHYAAVRGEEELVKKIMDHGAIVDHLDMYSRSPLYYAIEPGLPAASIVEILIRRDAETNIDTKAICSSTLIEYWRNNVHCLHGDYFENSGQTWSVLPFEVNRQLDQSDHDSLNKLPRFTGFRDDTPLKLFGYLHGEDCVTWVHLVSTVGSIQRGKINFDERKIVTSMSYNGVKEVGRLVLSYETRKEKEERLARDKEAEEGSTVTALPDKE